MKVVKELPKYCILLTINVVCFTLIIRTLKARLHRIPRTLELCALIPSFSRPEPKPWVRLTLHNHCWPQSNHWLKLTHNGRFK